MSKINVRFNKTIFIPYNLPWAVVNKLGLDSENHVFNGLGINNEDIKVISSIYFNPELSLKSGNYTKFKPNKDDLLSIKKGKA